MSKTTKKTAKKATKKVTKKSTRKKADIPEVSDETEFEPHTNRIVEVQTPMSRTRFHAPNEKVEFEREKYEDAKEERRVQGLRVVFPNPRWR